LLSFDCPILVWLCPNLIWSCWPILDWFDCYMLIWYGFPSMVKFSAPPFWFGWVVSWFSSVPQSWFGLFWLLKEFCLSFQPWFGSPTQKALAVPAGLTSQSWFELLSLVCLYELRY
jgi:hypothetical protein